MSTVKFVGDLTPNHIDAELANERFSDPEKQLKVIQVDDLVNQTIGNDHLDVDPIDDENEEDEVNLLTDENGDPIPFDDDEQRDADDIDDEEALDEEDDTDYQDLEQQLDQIDAFDDDDNW